MTLTRRNFHPPRRASCVVSLFAEAGDRHFPKPMAAGRHIDYLGSDGHVQSAGHGMHRMKTTIFEAHARLHPVLEVAGKKALFLLEAQRHRDEDLDDYLRCLPEAVALPMDHLTFYYSAHEMSPGFEERFNQATWQAVSAAAARTSHN